MNFPPVYKINGNLSGFSWSGGSRRRYKLLCMTRICYELFKHPLVSENKSEDEDALQVFDLGTKKIKNPVE